MIKTEGNPEGVPEETLDSFREAMKADRAKFFIDVPSAPFFGFNHPNVTTSQGKIWSWWRQGMTCGFKSAYDGVKAFSKTDFRDDLRSIEIPVLVLRGDDDQLVPIEACGRKTAKSVKNGKLVEFPGQSHALPTMCVDRVNEELLKFLKS